MKKSILVILLVLAFLVTPIETVNVSAKASKEVRLDGIEVYDLCMPGVVSITYNGGGGSGFFIESKKLITNYHVVKDADRLNMVDMFDNHYTVKSVLGYNEDLDIAIIETNEKGTPIKTRSHKLLPGETVFTLGCPWGIPFVITQGLLGKPEWFIDGKTTIMHTAPMSSGNSGGPLVNVYGEVIGINTLSSVGDNAQNLNYSVKIEEIEKVNTSSPMDWDTFVNRDSMPINTVSVKKAHTGDYIKLGTYEQDNNTKNGKEDIEWLVLAEDGDYLLVVSRFCLDITCWNKDNKFVSWKESEHRSFFNKFYKNAFTDKERKSIVAVDATKELTNPKNSGKDYLFLMSMEEIDTYFENIDKRASASEYCKALGAGDFGNKYTFWSTRTPSDVEEGKYFTVAVFGDITSDNPDGTSIVGRMATRPAMWIKR